MAPISREHNVPEHHNQDDGATLDEEAVVISGVSTVMPGCRNIVEFDDILYGKVNMVKCGKSRWNRKYPELSKYHGTIPQVDRFDAQFFMVYHRLAQTMDAMTRKLLEQSYQAIFDAGISPTELSGKSVGVFVSTGFCESEKASSFAELYLGIVACNRAMSANRISYYLNLKGPSMYLDGDAAGTAVALEKAYASIKSGQCEAAIVGGAKLLLHPQSSLHYNKQIPLSPDGNVKSYDKNADGHNLSEGITVIFLQKQKDAKRIYASIRHIKTSFTETTGDGRNQPIGPYREPEVLIKFFREFYEEANVSPSKVEYVEGFGSAIPKADKSELKAIDAVFCKNRKSVLPVGSVMSNTGYTDAACCLTALVKLILAYHKGRIAPNINCDSPREDVIGLNKGRLRILTEEADFGRSLAAVNIFSNTGINAHLLLNGHFKAKHLEQYHTDIPYVVAVSGRQEDSVQKILDSIKSGQLDPEHIGLLHNIHKTRIPKHLARGFGIYSTNEYQEAITVKEQVDYYDDARRPLWFVYSGMGSQWVEMGSQLMKIPIFAKAILRCHKALEPKGVDVINIITASDHSLFDNILHSFVGIAAMQIALTDVLKAVGLVPDNIIGHSVGELGCAYADGCATAEEMILMAYSRGLVSEQTPFIRGSMAAVGLGFKQVSKLVPPEIEVACHNGPGSSTISGPADVMQKFVAELIAQGVFAKEVNTSNIAYHSRYIAEAGPGLLKCLKEVLPSPKARSDRWISTSLSRDKWDEPIAKYSSAEYHTNNLLSPVLFEETLHLIPYNAVLVEIAPHGLLQAILKRSLPVTCKNIPLTRKDCNDGVMFLLEAIGKLYMEGFDMDMSALYPKIEFPVSTETKHLSHLVDWAYAEKYKICQYVSVDKKTNSVYKPIISVYDEEHEYLSGNIIEGKRVFPFSGALVLVWETLAMMSGKKREHLSVQFKDITFHTQPVLRDEESLHLTVLLPRGSGRFEVTYEHGIIAEGFVMAITTFTNLKRNLHTYDITMPMGLNRDDIYKLLFERGYQYKNAFRSIHKANMDFTKVQILWNDNWVTFLDGLIQMNVLRNEHKGISQPRFIKQICIDVMDHISCVCYCNKRSCTIDAVYSEVHNVISCGGVVIENITYKNKPLLLNQTIALKEHKFVPFFQKSFQDIHTTLYVYLQIIVENLNKQYLTVYYISDSDDTCILEGIKYLLRSPPFFKLNIIPVKKSGTIFLKKDCIRPDVVLIYDKSFSKTNAEILSEITPSDTFIINIGARIEKKYPSSVYRPICFANNGQDIAELAKWKPAKALPTTAAVSVRNEADFEHLKATKSELLGQHKLLIVVSFPAPSGMREFVQELRKEAENNSVFVVMINRNDPSVQEVEFPSFDLVYSGLDHGAWGGEFYVPIEENKSICNTASLKIGNFGDLNSLSWVETSDIIESNGTKVKIIYAGLNVHDARRATAEISIKDGYERGFGMDFSGITERGEKVMGVIKSGAASAKVTAQPDLLWPVPQHWTLEDAATVPLPYCLAFYCLAIKSNLVRGMNILIHGGAGALGQAAISICLANGCNVFTTVSNVYKKRFLCKMFPNLPANHIGNSRDISFQDMVINATRGEGCHIIISSVAGELKKFTLRCCAKPGLAIDTVLLHTQENFSYGMFNMMGSRSYTLIDFPSIFSQNNKDVMRLLQVMVAEGIAKGYVRPLSRVTYAPEDASRALRLLAASRHRGRVLLNLQDHLPAVRHRISCSSNACYMIFCDKDDFGLQIGDRLVNNGAKRIFIHSANAEMSSYFEYKTILWIKNGAQVQISLEKIGTEDHVIKLLKDCLRWAPIEGIFVIRTGLNESEELKVARNLVADLDSTSRALDLPLRYFAVFDENGLGHEISLKRSQNGLHSLSLELHNLAKFDTTELQSDLDFNWHCALNGIERAVCGHKPKVLAYAQTKARKSLIDEIANIPGTNIPAILPEDTQLADIGIDEGNSQELCNILEEKYNILISKENLPLLSISRLKALENNSVSINQESNGLAGYINFIDHDELMANCNTIQIPTLVNTSELRAEEIDNEQTFLCIIPGIESHHHRFRKLCERLKLPALVLQPGFDVLDETIEDIAQRLASIMMQKFVLQKHFYLLGYEFGILVAIEMAKILEKKGLDGTIYCVGGSPSEICSMFDAHFCNIDPEKLQNALIEHIYTLIANKKSNQLVEKIKDAKNWDEKVDTFMQIIYGQCSFSKQYLKIFINAIYHRIILARNYVWQQQHLKSRIVVLKAALTTTPEALQTDCGQFAVHSLNTSMQYALEDLRCSAIINKYLDQEILDAFKNKNHCETVLVHESEEFVFDYDDN